MSTKLKKEVELQLKIRSSTESASELERITTNLVENLNKTEQLLLVEKNVSVNMTSDKRLVTIVVTLQSQLD